MKEVKQRTYINVTTLNSTQVRSMIKKALVLKSQGKKDKKPPLFFLPQVNCEIMASMLDFVYKTPTMCADTHIDTNLTIHKSILKSDMDVLESWFAIPRKRRVKSRFKIDNKHARIKNNTLMWGGKKQTIFHLGVENIGSCLLQGHDSDLTHWIYTTRRMQAVRDKNLEVLLSQKKLHLVLDIDNTLIHCIKVPNLNNGDDIKLIQCRPGVLDFLKKASIMFELSIYTMGCRKYAELILSLLDPDKSLFNGRIKSREDCTTRMRKGLDVVDSDPRVVLIVDDRVDVWAENDRAHVIRVARYSYLSELMRNSDDNVVVDDNDKEMGRVWGVLSKVHSRFFDCQEEDWKSRDVAQVLCSALMPASK